jgi:inosine/xanthosine triphosphate pyrophosphatase family protein
MTKINVSDYKLVTSNDHKINEFKRFGLTDLTIEKGVDLPEIESSDPILVMLHKAKDAGVKRIVEDTSLVVDGAEVGTNIRWLVDELPKYNGKNSIWSVLLGVNDGVNIIIYRGDVVGKITNRFKEHIGNAFDCRFVPDGSDETLYELDLNGRKDNYSARKFALESLIAGASILSVPIKDVEEWKGEYQKKT